MEVLVGVLAILVAIAILYELARRLGVPFPTLMVLGGLGLAFVPGLPTIALEPELVLLVFLPPLLFSAAVATPRRDLRANLAPIARLSIGLVIFTMVSSPSSRMRSCRTSAGAVRSRSARSSHRPTRSPPPASSAGSALRAWS